MKEHSEMREYPCSLCSQSYRSLSILNRHLSFHKNIRRFPCPYCTRKFNLSSSRNFHIDSFHLKKAKFKQHIKKKEPIEDTEEEESVVDSEMGDTI